jgi:hypothetical protein
MNSNECQSREPRARPRSARLRSTHRLARSIDPSIEADSARGLRELENKNGEKNSCDREKTKLMLRRSPARTEKLKVNRLTAPHGKNRTEHGESGITRTGAQLCSHTWMHRVKPEKKSSLGVGWCANQTGGEAYEQERVGLDPKTRTTRRH